MNEDTYPADMLCKHGHMSPRYKETNLCVECMKENRLRIIRNKSILAKLEPPKLSYLPGGTRYSTGEPCKRCDTTHRYIVTGKCCKCHPGKRRKGGT